MGARGNLRYDAAERGMRLGLIAQFMRHNLARARRNPTHQCRRGFVAARFDAQNSECAHAPDLC